MPVAHHLPQARFDVQERGRQPAVALARVLPVIDLRTAFFDERIDGLETVRRLQRPAQHPVQPEAMQRQGLVQPFRQTPGRRLVPVLQLAMERLERGEGLVRTLAGCRRVGGAGATKPARVWPDTSPRSRAYATGTAGPGPGSGRPSERPIAAPCRRQGSPARPGRRRGPARPTTAGTASAPARSRCPFRRSPGSVFPRYRNAQRDDHRRVRERLAVQDHGHHVLAG